MTSPALQASAPTQSGGLLPPAQLAALSPAQQQAYLSGLNQQQAAAEQSALADYKRAVNRDNTNYLMQSLDKYAICPSQAGGGSSATYALGTTLYFNFPSMGGGYVRELLIEVDIKFTANGTTSPTVAWTPAGAYAWFSEIGILYNGQQAKIRPYLLKVLDQIKYKQRLPYNQVLSGLDADSTTTNFIAAAQPAITAGTAAISKFFFRLPMQLHRWSPIGMLPAQGQGTKGQVYMVCTGTAIAINPDPLAVPLNLTAGTAPTFSLDSTEKTITCWAIYNDGTNMASKTPLPLHLENLPTAQYIIDSQLNPLSSGTLLKNRLLTLEKHYIVLSVIVDGVQSTSFATTANITEIALAQDSNAQNLFWLYGTQNNTTMNNYFERIRQLYGQDLDPGVILWVNAEQFNTVDADDAAGAQVLDMTTGHWTDTNLCVQLTSVSNTNFAARMETYIFCLNDAGLVLG